MGVSDTHYVVIWFFLVEVVILGRVKIGFKLIYDEHR